MSTKKIFASTQYLLKKLIFRRRRIELDYFHLESDPGKNNPEDPVNPV
jgi:hypothetical protein